MWEWLALVVLVPLVLIPIVLLFGFAGCQLVFPHQGEPTFVTTFEIELPEQSVQPRCTVIVRLEPPLRHDGNRVRVILQRASGDLVIRKLFISHAAPTGNRYDAAADLREVVGEAGQLVLADPEGGPFELGTVDFQLDRSKPVLLAFDTGDAAAMREAATEGLPIGQAFVSLEGVFEADKPIRSQGYRVDDRIYAVQRIEVA